MNSVLQAKCKNLGLNLKDLFILEYLKSKYIFVEEFKSSDIVNENPLLETPDIKSALEKLEDCGLIYMDKEWDRGAFSISFVIEKMIELYKIEDVEIKKEKKKTVKKQQQEVSDEVKLILDEYNKTDMPSASLTDRRKKAINSALSKYKVEDIVDAMRYACSQRWVLDKSSEKWMDLAWILTRIDEFMEGGKYRKKQEVKQESIIPISKVSVIL